MDHELVESCSRMDLSEFNYHHCFRLGRNFVELKSDSETRFLMPKAIEIEKMTPAKTRKKCEIRSKLTIKTPEKRRIFIFNFSRKGVNIYIYIYIYIYLYIYIYIYI